MPEQLNLDLQVCENCGQSENDCECVTCTSCGERTDSLCDNCEHCNDCCECSICARSRCSARVDHVCPRCERCDDCCECSICDNCGDRVEGTCGECNCCDDCCSCHSSDVEYVNGCLTFHKAERNQFKINTSRRFIALEIEVSSGDSHEMTNTLNDWDDSLVEDGSLPDTGWELNLNPSQGDVFLDHTREIASALSYADAQVNRSCGMHCHVGAEDFGWFDLFKLCRLYTRIEEGLYALLPRSRQDNHYCRRCASDYTFDNYQTFKRDLISRMYGWRIRKGEQPSLTYARKGHKNSHGESRQFYERTQKYMDARYRALNLHSFFYRGTVEFRHHAGTVNLQKMQQWGMICANILDAASRMTLRQIDETPMGFEGLLSILPETLAQWANERKTELKNRGE